MRYGVLSDIHGNLFALRTAIECLTREGVDGWLCAGDTIGYGPQPNECVETIAELDALCVAGNHELILLGKLDGQRSGRLARETLRWTRTVLRQDCRSYLSQLPRIIAVDEIVMAHGSLEDSEQYIKSEAQAAEQLRQLEYMYAQARFLILGHTHQTWAYSRTNGTVTSTAPASVPLLPPDQFLLNPGAVGQSRQRESEPRARFMLLDLEYLWARFFTASYDSAACREALRQRGLPDDCIHIRPGLLPTALRRGRRLIRKLAVTQDSR